MSLRHPVVITTLQEDLRKIGLLPQLEDDGDLKSLGDPSDADGPESKDGDIPDVLAAGKPKVKVEADDEDSSLPPPASEDDDKADGCEDCEDDEVPVPAGVAAQAAEARQHVARLAKRYLKQHARSPSKGKARVEARKSTASKMEARLHRLAEGKLAEGREARPSTISSRTGRLIEDVAKIVGGLQRAKHQEHIKSFANVAVISEMLSKRFRALGMALQEGNLYKVGGKMERLAKRAGYVALRLEDGDVLPPASADIPQGEADPASMGDDDLNAMFKKFMAKMLDALQLYNDTGAAGAEEDGEMPPVEEPPTGEADDSELPPPPSDEDDDEKPFPGAAAPFTGEGDSSLPPPPSDEDDDEGDSSLPPPAAEGDDDSSLPPPADEADDEGDSSEPPPAAEADDEDDDEDDVVEAVRRLLGKPKTEAKRSVKKEAAKAKAKKEALKAKAKKEAKSGKTRRR